ncbi:uncharacterized protein LOC121250389 [Juglans microcarpa x Juglans regia]|uniref:uncharacterized protein LOC121250389 n=1 Tax=Juglans microcarpa x Juglans regia TaxID=2249226 RepID=UPI001B7DB631|nr:uncharacterized protein LOC121250389 [Juglans microcarpa x Juglans regia]
MQEENEETVAISTENCLVWEDQAVVEGVEKATTKFVAMFTEVVLKEIPKEMTPSVRRNSNPMIRVMVILYNSRPSPQRTSQLRYCKNLEDSSTTSRLSRFRGPKIDPGKGTRLVWHPPWPKGNTQSLFVCRLGRIWVCLAMDDPKKSQTLAAMQQYWVESLVAVQ